MAEPQVLQVIRIWAAMAWADGKIAPAEAAALGKLIERAGLAATDRAQASEFLETRVELDTSELGALSAEARSGIYGAACRLAAVDQHLAAGERVFLDKLRDGMKIPIEVAQQVERGVPGLTP